MRDHAADFLPLTHLAFHVLLALAEGPAHGYALVRDVRDRSGGAIDPGTGSFYSVIRGLGDQGLLAPTAAPDDRRDERRRYYAITPLGRRVLDAETSRLKGLIREAERRRARQAAARGTR
ncbi:MAG: PadR family transcriptional regulator [Vicinamibacterales bacterium]